MNALSAPLTTPVRSRRPTKIRIWVPLLLLLLLLSPLLLLLGLMGAVVLKANGLPPGRTLAGIARVLPARRPHPSRGARRLGPHHRSLGG